MRLYVISALIIAFLAILFALQNTNLVTIQLFIWEYRQSLALILLGSFAIGVIVGLLVSVPAMIRRNVRISQAQTQIDKLLLAVDGQVQTTQAEAQKNIALQQDYERKLHYLGLLEPVTTLIHEDLLPKAIAAQLRDAHSHNNETSSPPAFSVLMFKVLPVLENGSSLPDVWVAVAQVLQGRATSNTWLYSDGQGHFAATVTGLNTKATTQYGEALQAAILENLPVLSTGQAVNLDVSVGGAIADVARVTDSHQLIQTAEAALEQALQRGRNRIKISSLA